jgi:hypothetical protein
MERISVPCKSINGQVGQGKRRLIAVVAVGKQNPDQEENEKKGARGVLCRRRHGWMTADVVSDERWE